MTIKLIKKILTNRIENLLLFEAGQKCKQELLICKIKPMSIPRREQTIKSKDI